jgi:hypothetical protein
MLGGGVPLEPILLEMRGMGLSPPRPPRMEASRMEALLDLWKEAGLNRVESREIEVHRTFANFDEFWLAKQKAPSIAIAIASMNSADVETLKGRVRARLTAGPEGRIIYAARANAIRGYSPD